MKKVPLNVSVDDELKQSAEKLFSDIGLNMTTAITVFLKQSLRTNGIPFELSVEKPVMNLETVQTLIEVMQRNNLSKRFDNVSNLMEDLDAED